ncbi:MAG: phosphatase PAP2 family protein [Streptosporangiaceae bacterium]
MLGGGSWRAVLSWQTVQGAAAFGSLAVIAVRARGGPLGRIDRKLPGALQDRRSPAGITAARVVSSLAEPEFVSALLTARALTTWRRDRRWAAFAPCLIVAAGAMARRRLSRVIRRRRPPESGWLARPEGFSLPSKHTTLAALTAGALISTRGGSRAGQAAPLLTAAAVGASRVYLGVHWPTDILAGWLFAEGWLRLAGAAADMAAPVRGDLPAAAGGGSPAGAGPPQRPAG